MNLKGTRHQSCFFHLIIPMVNFKLDHWAKTFCRLICANYLRNEVWKCMFDTTKQTITKSKIRHNICILFAGHKIVFINFNIPFVKRDLKNRSNEKILHFINFSMDFYRLEKIDKQMVRQKNIQWHLKFISWCRKKHLHSFTHRFEIMTKE